MDIDYDTWRRMTAFERDLLVDLKHAEHALTGMELCERNEHIQGRTTSSSAYRHLESLESDGYVNPRERNGKSREWDISDRGEQLLETVVWAIQTGDGL